jgi:hypothetical protein
MAACVLGLAAGSARAADPFAQPVRMCAPCRFSPGKGMPDYDVTFRLEGAGDARVLHQIVLAPASGGPAQVFDAGDVAISDFPDGFSLSSGDIDGSGRGDIGLVTQQAADNTVESFWVYDPAQKRFAVLQRDDQNGGECPIGWDVATHELTCHVVGSYVEYDDYSYRLEGDRTVAVAVDSQKIDGALLKDETADLAVTPPRLLSSRVVGFMGNSPEYTAFLARLAAAHLAALAKYEAGDRAAAAAAMAPVLQGMNLDALTSGFPIQGAGTADDRLVIAALNDDGFFLAQAGRNAAAIEPLSAVTQADPARIPA